METESGEFYTFTHTHASDLFIYSVLSIHSLGATRFWKGVMQGSWSLETTVLKPLPLGYTLQLLTGYKGDRFSYGCGRAFLSVKGSTHIEVTGPISLPTHQALQLVRVILNRPRRARRYAVAHLRVDAGLAAALCARQFCCDEAEPHILRTEM